jgi:fluoride exporter
MLLWGAMGTRRHEAKPAISQRCMLLWVTGIDERSRIASCSRNQAMISFRRPRRVGETFPWGTMVVNVSGAFLLGILAASAASHGLFAAVRPWQFAAIGILGTYTTVSSFSLQTLALARDGEMMRAAGNMVLSLSLCLVAVTGGFAAGLYVLG